MAWGDAWGSTPWEYHKRLAAAFFAGRELGTHSKAQVINRYGLYMEYLVRGTVLARFTPECMRPNIVAGVLTGEYEPGDYYPELAFRCYEGNKAEARHLRALGIECHHKCAGRPFLAYGVDIGKNNFVTIAQLATRPKWSAPVKSVKSKREPFVDLTMQLFT